MWWVKTDSSGEDRGGFQNRDIGRQAFDSNFGPDFGVDYARFSDPPNLVRDNQLKEKVIARLNREFSFPLEVKVRNKFVLVKGEVADEATRRAVIEELYSMEEVLEVIADLHIKGKVS